MKSVIAEEFERYRDVFFSITKNFQTGGKPIGPGSRNIVKVFEIAGKEYNFKSFKQHNFINRHVYKYYRKSKARRSFEYANLLISKNFLTPKPVAYIENTDFWGVTSSYYISEQLQDCFTLSDALFNPDFPNREKIFQAYTALIFNLHENGIEFIDNASGNFLIKEDHNTYQFYLVDLNRMNFLNHYPIEKRLSNFERLTTAPEIIKIISEEYALLSGKSPEFCQQKILSATNRKVRKNKIKKNLKFYKYFLKK